MIPQNIKSEIDKYKSRIATDDELTALFDLVNSAKLKGHQQEEVWDYFEKAQKEAEASLKAKEQETIEKQKRKEQEERERRIQQAKLAAKKAKEKEERDFTLFGVGFSVLVPFGSVLFTDGSLSVKLIELGILGLIITLTGVFMYRGLKKVAFRLLCLTLFYVVLCVAGFFMIRNNGTESTSNSDSVSGISITDNIDASKIQEQLTVKFGQEYNFRVEVPEKMLLNGEEVHFEITAIEKTTQKEGSCWVVKNKNGRMEIKISSELWSMSEGKDIEEAITEMLK